MIVKIIRQTTGGTPNKYNKGLVLYFTKNMIIRPRAVPSNELREYVSRRAIIVSPTNGIAIFRLMNALEIAKEVSDKLLANPVMEVFSVRLVEGN